MWRATAEQFWIVGLQGERHWPALCWRSRPDWLTDDRFATGRGRATNAGKLIGELDEIFATKSLDEWAKIFASEPDFFWSPINSMEDVVADEQFHAAGGVIYVPEDDSSVPMVATPADFHGTRALPAPSRPASVRTPRKYSPNSSPAQRRPLQIAAKLSRCRNGGGDDANSPGCRPG